ncbi:Hint domain-containing protein [Paenibacillus sp. Z6-24]
MYKFLTDSHNRVLEQIDPHTGMLELDLSDHDHYDFFLRQIGGIEQFEQRHPHLMPVLKDLQTRPLLRSSKISDTGYHNGPDNKMAIENLIFQPSMQLGSAKKANDNPDGLALASIIAEYIEEKEHISVISHLYDVTNDMLLHTTADNVRNTCSYEGTIQANYPRYFKDTPQEFMIYSTFYCSTRAKNDFEPARLNAYVTKNEGFTLQGNKDIIKSFTLNDPVIQPKHQNDPAHTEVKISYIREGAIPDYDYTNDDQPFVYENHTKILVRVPFSVTVEAADKWSIIGLDEQYGYRMWLKNMVNGTVNFYGNPDEIIQRKDAFDDQNQCIKMTFIFPQSWNNILDFSEVGYNPYTNVDFYSSFGVVMSSDYDLTIGVSVKSDGKDYDMLNIQSAKIFIQWGCVARDTEIEMSDGVLKRADQVQIGEMVRCLNGDAVQVRKVLTGYEHRLYSISTASRSIRVTPDHMMCTEQGLQRAIELKVGMQLQTVDGLETITDLKWSDYKDTVYNFEFDTETILIGNGLLIGDSMLQNRKKELIMHEN